MTQKVDMLQRRAKLSPAKRALLEKRLLGALTPPSESQAIPRRPEPELVPLSFAQERLWFLAQLESGSPAYNRPLALRLTGSLNVAALEQSLSEILRRHEVLRATFRSVEGRPIQVITPARPLKSQVIDLSGLPPVERESQAMHLATEKAQRPFDLAQGPLLRVTLLRLDREEHVLLLVMHHIVFDGWSARVFIREIAALYKALSKGNPSPLPELPIQYADFAHWQREWLPGEVLEEQLAYWKKQFADAPPALELPTDRPRPPIQTYHGARQSIVLSKTLSKALKELSQREEVTLFMTLLAAFETLLYRYTGQDDIVVGSPIANRNRAEVEELIGFFVNTLVLRLDLSGNPTFRQLLARTREVALGAYDHQDLPFEKLVQELQPERDLSRTPLFQAMFNLENIPHKAVEIQGLSISEFEFDSRVSQCDLSLEMVEKDTGLSCSLNCNTDLFDATTITRMLGHYQTLLEGVVANPDQPILSLPLLTEAERHQLLVEWNDTQADYPQDVCVHELFETQVERAPDAVAVVFENQRLTYRDLNARANQLAHYLQALGVGPEVLVGICVERSVEMIVGLLGILKAGGAYVPLDPTYPKERLAFMLKDTQTPVLLTQQHLLEELPEHGAAVVCLDTDWEAMARESDKEPISGTAPENLAYVIYTSGSTGRPKGTCIPHRGVVRLVRETNYVRLTSDEVFLQFAPISFDASTFEIWGSLLNGARLVIFPAHTPSLAELGQAIQRYQITTLWLTAGLFHQMVEWYPKAFRNVRQLLAGGDVLSVSHVELALQRLGDCQLINGYGPTENTTFTCCYPITDGSQIGTSVSIGRPVANTQVYILGRDLNPVPIGVPGELYIGGDGLARGYLNLLDLTAERFIPHSFSTDPEARLYRTGDLARYLPDGNIEFLGRMDHQAKVRGFRVELGEIETVLGGHLAVREAVVLAREDQPGEKHLVAYVVPGPGQAPAVSELRGFLKKKLPDYMVPSAFVFLDALPLTPSGKVDRRALPAPDRTRPDLKRAFVAPRDALGRQVTKVWEQVLRIQPIGVRDNFFDLGGHSMLAVRLLAQIEKTFGQKLPLVTLFQAPTVEQLTDVLRESQKGESAAWSPLVAVQPAGSRRPFFCVPGNLGNVFTDLGCLARHLGPDQPFYGLQDGTQNPTQIETLAAYYLDEMRAVQPAGPYLLGGVCSGGVVAFEMAQQLQARGQGVPLLALVEPSPPRVPGLRSYFNFATSIMRRSVRRFGHHSHRVSQLSSAEQRAYIRLKVKLIANSWAVRRYAPRPYPGRIHLFLTTESLRSPHNPQLGWCELAAGGAEVYEIPGSHDIITGNNDTRIEEAHMQVLAKQLRACIDDALTDDYRS